MLMCVQLFQSTQSAMRRFLRVQIVFFAMLLVAASFFLSAMNHAHAAGNVLEYTYDAAGRIVAVKRQASPGLAIAGFSPAAGAVGTAVTISGNAFDPTAANNIVKFNGLAATVVTASSTDLVVTVPTGATTGKISITVAGVTATSVQDFVVSIPGAPTISGFTPLSGVAGASVSVSGTNFAVAAATTRMGGQR